ncbi:LOW QUALITY PROTEIN: uncharacterized protein B0I36DRAFT_424926 [Microdochium trichocladiopsis]|uniref:Polyketide synthase n=1 Tax=Microdochium trichocladiopsis TaxID=1682393 RepID=A0A9P8XW92_9PEZI|nr:LOW QUALITY PROTEIN: uncharacterized protein B0I36DRAFT_424926 [Microdochium trichocladiopsis]KAH7021066.1 LOW QUALITY PROTEIN: hypothetical protein B0I36DRAFT_424926 [Microdochium trichocladiopsis]
MSQAVPAEPIAVVSSSCRITTPHRLWDILSNPPDLSKEVPQNRFMAKAFYHPDGTHHGTTNSIRGYWLEQDHRAFDAGFFHINGKEADAMDPQQRMVLEVVYEAMESAGYQCQRYAGKDVAVFAGVMTADYEILSRRDELQTDQYHATGNARSMIANRVSYFFDFRGPSVTVDTACSSSLVAVHQAVQSLRSAESIMACVTGVNLMLTPDHFIVESDMHMLRRCRMWDVRADGYARGEGVAAVLLKTQSQAMKDGDTIHAIIRETGVNSDGRTEGITMPNMAAQSRLIQQTYRRAGLDACKPEDRCQYFEAHGTGTAAGDPREAAAIKQAFFGEAPELVGRKLLVGSIKTVVGHTEGAAGLAGLLKVVEALKHGAIPPNLHMERPSPSVEPCLSHLEVPTRLSPWPRAAAGQPRRASVNSFGFGGTNAHAIVESYGNAAAGARDDEAVVVEAGAGVAAGVVPLCISAASPQSLVRVAHAYRTLLQDDPGASVQLLACCLASRRDALPYRLALSVASREQALDALGRLLNHPDTITAKSTHAATMDHPPKLLAIFTGQGAQWPAMGRSLLRSNSVFRQTVLKLDAVLAACYDPPSWTLVDQIQADDAISRVHEAAVAQPLCTAIQIALVDLLQSLRIALHTVIGHSSGEIAAAYAAGRLTMQDAMLISYYRGLVISQAQRRVAGPPGGMLAVGLSEGAALGFCRDDKYAGRLFVAAGNGPTMATISGDLDMVKQAKADLDSKHIAAKILRVDAAYHSPYLATAAADYMKALERCRIAPIAEGNDVVWISSVYGFKRTSEGDLGAGYWKDNMLYTVQFHDAVEHALSEFGPYDVAVEIGPHAALRLPVSQTAAASGQELPYTGILDRTKDDSVAVADFLGFMWSTLGSLEVHNPPYLEQTSNNNTISTYLERLPRYPWNHSQTYQKVTRLSRQYLGRSDAPHELLGVRCEDDGHVLRWRNVLKPDRVPWLRHHRFQGQCLLPASAYCLMALHAAQALPQQTELAVVELSNIEIVSGVVIDEAPHGTEIVFTITTRRPREPSQSGIKASFCLVSCPGDGSTDLVLNMTGELELISCEEQPELLPSKYEDRSHLLETKPETFYQMMESIGLTYTGPFRGIRDINRRLGYCDARVAYQHQDSPAGCAITPALLDSCFQTAFLTYASPGDRSLWGPLLPCRIDRLLFAMKGLGAVDHDRQSKFLHVDAYLTRTRAATRSRPTTFAADMGVCNHRGQKIVQVEGLTVRAIANASSENNTTSYFHTVLDVDPCYEAIRMGSHSSDMPVYDGLLNSRSTGVSINRSKSNVKEINHDGSYYVDENQPMAQDIAQFHDHVGRLLQQITHRYPWTNCLCLPDSSVDLPLRLLHNTNIALDSLTIGTMTDTIQDAFTKNRVHGTTIIRLDRARSLYAQLERRTRYEIVVLSVSHLERRDWPNLLGAVRELMRPGGFLILFHEHPGRRKRPHALISSGHVTPPDWPDELLSYGFRSLATHSDQRYPHDRFVMVRQLAPIKPLLTEAQGYQSALTKIDHVVIIAGTNGMLQDGLHKLSILLLRRCLRITVLGSIQAGDLCVLETCTAVIIISDDEEPLETMTARHNLKRFQALFRPNMVVLWVVQNSRSGAPGHAAVLGFTRTIAAEVASLRIQTLDLCAVSSPETHIANAFLQLTLSTKELGGEDALWTHEAEVHIHGDRRFIPRLKPLHRMNERAHAFRCPLTRSTDISKTVVAVRPRNATVIDFSEVRGSFATTLRQLLPTGCLYVQARESIFGASLFPEKSMTEMAHELKDFWARVVTQSLEKHQRNPPEAATDDRKVMTLPALLEMTSPCKPHAILDWTATAEVDLPVQPLAVANIFSPTRTYLLIGLTRDLGQSLSRLFIQHGARHIVLASRNPDLLPSWVTELELNTGAIIRLVKLDLEQVIELRRRLLEEYRLPPVGGLINGAMVLDDRIFAHMTTDTWDRVMRPKTVGSSNLDQVFDSGVDELEFFIMTSSFAAIGGHAGQSNYAAANMYMNGLAANRRKRGLTGSVLNIGVIYGLGFLHREKRELYAGLEREGYPPISEHDVHHMVLEAVVAGRPNPHSDQPYDIVTGLSRFKRDDPNHNSPHEACRLSELGVDSLLAVDIRNWAVRKLGVDLAVMKILGPSTNIRKLCCEMAVMVAAERGKVQRGSA